MTDYLYEYQFESLTEDFVKCRPMILYLGAGINAAPNVNMKWDALLNCLRDAAGLSEEDLRSLAAVQQDLRTSVLKYRLGVSYIPIIQDFLYNQCNRDILSDAYKKYEQYKDGALRLWEVPFCSLFILAELIVRRRNIVAVVTQNYDNFLSEAIDLVQSHIDVERRIKNIEVFDGMERLHDCKNTIRIYHIHGYIPPLYEAMPNPQDNHIVLSQDETFDMQRNVYSWQTTVQLYFFSHYTCLITGLSLTDMSTLRMISYSDKDRKTEKLYYLTAHDNIKRQVGEGASLLQSYYEHIGLNVIDNQLGYYPLYKDLYERIIKK